MNHRHTALNTAYANALERGNTQAADAIKKQLNILSVYGGKYVELSQKLQSEISRMGQLKAKYASYKVNIENTIPQIFIVDKARVEEKKVSPKRTIIVMMSNLIHLCTCAYSIVNDRQFQSQKLAICPGWRA